MSTRCYLKVLIVASLFCIAFGVGIPLLIGNIGDDPSEDTAMAEIEEKASEAPTWLVPNMTSSTLLALEDPFSVQSRAYDWISRDPNWEDYEDWRRQQRFALACIHHTFGSSFSRQPNYYMSDCLWMQDLECSASGQVTALKLQTHVTLNVPYQYIPPEVSYLSALKTLVVRPYYNRKVELEKMLPLDTLRVFPPITKLDVSDCYVAGSIPTSLGQLTSLSSLDASGNQLSSVVPSELGLLSSLNSLDLSSNTLSGSIPRELGDLPDLSIFHIEFNALLEPELPKGFCTHDRTPLEFLETDWCSDTFECCLLGSQVQNTEVAVRKIQHQRGYSRL